MNDIGSVLAKLLLDNPQFIPAYLIGLWFFIIRPMLKGSGEKDSSSIDPKQNSLNTLDDSNGSRTLSESIEDGRRDLARDTHAEEVRRIEEKEVACHRCGKTEVYAAVPCDLWVKCRGGLSDALGYVCRSCHAPLCKSCMAKHHVKRSWWSGYEKVRCPECDGLFGPGHILYPSGRPDLLLRPE